MPADVRCDAGQQRSGYLSESHTQHDQDAGAGPEGDPPQVVLQQVPVSRLEGPQHRLHLPAALQPSVQSVHGLLGGGARKRFKELTAKSTEK